MAQHLNLKVSCSAVCVRNSEGIWPLGCVGIGSLWFYVQLRMESRSSQGLLEGHLKWEASGHMGKPARFLLLPVEWSCSTSSRGLVTSCYPSGRNDWLGMAAWPRGQLGKPWG